VLFAIILTFVFTVYATSDKIGSPAAMHRLLTRAAEVAPVAGNAHGSYVTMRSKNGCVSRYLCHRCPGTNKNNRRLIFGVINVIGNFATVFEDQAYWQSPSTFRPSELSDPLLTQILQGLLLPDPVPLSRRIFSVGWHGELPPSLLAVPAAPHSSPSFPRFAIPFTFATTLGLAAVALRFDPDMKVLSPADVSAGLPASAAASALLGRSGAAAVLILLFLAVTSASSAEMIAVSSILTYDVYKVCRSLFCGLLELVLTFLRATRLIGVEVY
jgi:hypothetical protein